MKIATIAVTNLPNSQWVKNLKDSAVRHKIDLKIIESIWRGFFTKVDEAHKFAENTSADYIMFVDAHDVLFVDGLEKVKDFIVKNNYPDAIFSTEKACWPDAELAKLYPKTPEFEATQWKYLNSGSYLAKPDYIIECVDIIKPFVGMDDQHYWALHYIDSTINDNTNFVLDYNCEIFQTLAHDNGESFGVIEGKFQNKVTGTRPMLAHGNGKAMDEFDYSYLNDIK